MENITSADREIIAKIDSSLICIERLRPSSLLVCKVEKDSSFYVLKVGRPADKWEINQVLNEIKILDRARDVEGITHLVHGYGENAGYRALLKEYVEGKTLIPKDENMLPQTIHDAKLQASLIKTVHDLHSLDIISLDIAGQNIVVSPDNRAAYLIDLGNANNFRFDDNLNVLKRRDFYRLEQLFGR